MKVVILEDESRAANHLERLISRVAPEMKVIARLESVRDAVPFLKLHADIDLIFSDVQLADGLSFEIFGQITVKCPIIFTTAYDHYAIEAFKTNGIDYLLKPVEEERLRKAIEKSKLFSPAVSLEKLLSFTNNAVAKAYKSRFMVKVGDKIKSIPIEEILAFYSLEKATYLHTTSHRDYCIDYSVDQLESLLDPAASFRINRKYIVSIQACTNILAWTNSRLRLKIEGIADDDIVVARERVQDFKDWLDR
ncbi:MAG: LytTR family DNA-binding domain-containing protein [Bacteroidota bacterium]